MTHTKATPRCSYCGRFLPSGTHRKTCSDQCRRGVAARDMRRRHADPATHAAILNRCNAGRGDQHPPATELLLLRWLREACPEQQWQHEYRMPWRYCDCWDTACRKHVTADIVCPSLSIIIEIDGEPHYRQGQRQRDAARDAVARRHGWHTIRIPAASIRRHGVAAAVQRYAVVDRVIRLLTEVQHVS